MKHITSFILTSVLFLHLPVVYAEDINKTANVRYAQKIKCIPAPLGVYDTQKYDDEVIKSLLFSESFSLCTSSDYADFETTSSNVMKELIAPCILVHFSQYGLKLLRNSIYARYGFQFKSQDLNAFFQKQKWYKKNKSFSFDLLTETQKQNVRQIKLIEILKAKEKIVETNKFSEGGIQNSSLPQTHSFFKRFTTLLAKYRGVKVRNDGFLEFKNSAVKIDLRKENPPEETDLPGYYLREKRKCYILKDRIVVISPAHFVGPMDSWNCNATMYSFAGEYLGSLYFCPKYFLNNNPDLVVGIDNHGCCGASDISINFFNIKTCRKISFNPDNIYLLTYFAESDLFLLSSRDYITNRGGGPDLLISLWLFDSKLNIKASGFIKNETSKKYLKSNEPFYNPGNIVRVKELGNDKVWGLKYTHNSKNYYLVLKSNDNVPHAPGLEVKKYDLKKKKTINDIRYKEPITTFLIKAVINEDLKEVKRLVSKGENVNKQLDNGTTALIMAAQKGYIEIADYLLRNGAKPDLKKKNFERPARTALDIAIRYNHPKMAELLIEKGGALPAEKEWMDKPLFRAIMKNRPAIVEFLLKHGADVKDKHLLTALSYRYYDIAKILANKGAKLTVSDNEMTELLLQAVDSADAETVDILLENGADPEKIPLISAIANSSDIAIKLINKGIDVHQADNKGRTPLMKAAELGRIEVVKILIDKKADVNARDNTSKTPLLYAAPKCQLSLFKLLVNAGADIHAKDYLNNPRSVLAYAMLSYNYKVIEFLLTKDVEREKKIIYNRDTPLRWAITKKDTKMIKILIDGGVNINNNRFGCSPLTTAISFNHIEGAKLLIESGADLLAKCDNKTQLSYTATYGSLEMFKLIYNVDPSDINYALSVAALEGQIEIVKYILDNNKSVEMNKALDWAVSEGKIEVVRLLLKNGANANSSNRYGDTPLHHAYSPEIVKLLIAAGADVNIKNRVGKTALMRAKRLKLVKIIKILEEHDFQ